MIHTSTSSSSASQIRPGFFVDYIVTVKVHNNTPWDVNFYQRYLDEAEKINQEPESAPANTVRSGGIYQDDNGPYGVSALIVYDSPDSDWKFAWDFAVPFVGNNSVNASIISSSTSVDGDLYKTLDNSNTKTTSKVLTVDGTKYTFTASKFS